MLDPTEPGNPLRYAVPLVVLGLIVFAFLAFRPGRRSYPPPGKLTVPDQWSVASGTHKGRPVIVRIRAGAQQYAGHPAYPHQVSITVPFLKPRSDGMPPKDEEKTLGDIEDALSSALGASKASLFVAAVTTRGRREFIFYTSDPKRIDTQVNDVRRQFPERELQVSVKRDPKWQTYCELADAL